MPTSNHSTKSLLRSYRWWLILSVVALAPLPVCAHFDPACEGEPPREDSKVRLAEVAPVLWSQSQLASAAAADLEPIRWAEACIYGGLDGDKMPLAPVDWPQLAQFASQPIQAVLLRAAEPNGAAVEPLRLHRPQTIAHRFLYDYDATLSNVIYVEHLGERWNGRFFDLHFFEEVFIPFDPAVTFRNGRRINDNLFLWSRPAGWQDNLSRDEYLFYMIQSDSIFFECAGRVWVEGATLHWDALVVNHSRHDWSHPDYYGSGALMCLRARNNPDFHDTTGARIYYHDAAGHRLTRSVQGIEGNSSIYFHQWTFMSDAAYSTCLTKYNQAGDLWITAAANTPRSVSGNKAQSFSCIHPNLGWAIPAGGSQLVSARVEFHHHTAASPNWLLAP